MKTERLTYTLVGSGIVALAWLLSGVGSPINADALLPYGAVVAILALAAVDYRLSAKRLLGR